MEASSQQGLENSPAGQKAAAGDGINLHVTAANLVPMAPQMLAPAGGDQPHNNLQPYLTFYFCIALQGVFPPRT
jgi:microcystin-dependent protein